MQLKHVQIMHVPYLVAEVDAQPDVTVLRAVKIKKSIWWIVSISVKLKIHSFFPTWILHISDFVSCSVLEFINFLVACCIMVFIIVAG